jgi:hypothetical protein
MPSPLSLAAGSAAGAQVSFDVSGYISGVTSFQVSGAGAQFGSSIVTTSPANPTLAHVTFVPFPGGSGAPAVSPGTVAISAVNLGPGGGASNLVPLFVTAQTTAVTDVTAVTTTDASQTTATAGGSGAGTTGSVTAVTDPGTGTVAVANYSSNPGATPSFSTTGSYFDVYVAPLSTFGSVTITYCDPTGGDVLYWFDGANWIQLGGVTVTPASPGTCLSLTVTNDPNTHPNIADLQGTVLGVGVNRAPTAAAVSGPSGPVQVATSVVVGVPFADLDTGDHHTASWNWGDGTSSPGIVAESSGAGSATGSHVYAAAGVYTVVVTVSDNHGKSAQQTFQYVVVYDPAAGYVTGGGWINSPAGAYVPDPSLSGKATFGFVSQYKKGANVPTGNTQFQFHAAGLDFKSTAYEWLVVAGAKAQYKGAGTINGTGNYGFLLTATDGQVNGGGGTDKFRIKIWDVATGNIVYDNQLGADDNADPTTVLGGGSIVIQK